MTQEGRVSGCLHHGVIEEKQRQVNRRLDDLEEEAETMKKRIDGLEKMADRVENSIRTGYFMMSFIVTVGTAVGGLLARLF